MRSLADRLWEKVEKTDTCWNWTGNIKPNGYGQMSKGRRGEGLLHVHRVAWELVRGPIPPGFVIDHRCKNRRCVNPDHLEPVTNRENVVSRSNGPSGINSRKTHCINGHSLEGAYIYPNGNRKCRECNRIHLRNLRKNRKLSFAA